MTAAFTFRGDKVLYDHESGQPLPSNWKGHCTVYFGDGYPCRYRTWIHNGERHWRADNPNGQGYVK